MKTRISFLLTFLLIFLCAAWVPPVLSKNYSDTKSNDTFSFDGSTTSTSQKLAGYGSESWHVTGYASLSATASELGQDSIYKCELWLMVTGDLDSSPFPDKGNIAAEAGSDGTGGKQKLIRKGDASILYRSQPVGSLAEGEVNIYDSQVVKSLSRTLSESYANSASSPTGLCASPEFHGDLSGTMMNFAGSKSVLPLSFKSKANKACADSPDAGMDVIAGEKCKRGSLCLKPGTATSPYSHRVECPEERWVWEGIKIGSHKFFSKKQDCEVVWWTCDKKVDVCDKTASHVPASEKSWQNKYVAPDGSVSQYPPSASPTYHACGEHETSVSGDHSLQASCTSTDSNGNTCTVTSFYACDSHTHSYPSPPPTVSCGRSACTASVSSSTEHRVGPCSACGGSYWSCGKYGSYWENQHRVRTCRRSGCGNTWQRCVSSTPDCSAKSDSRCWAR